MGDLINRQTAVEELYSILFDDDMRPTIVSAKQADKIIDAIRKAPSEQPERIRCKNCRYASPNGAYGCWLERFSIHDMDERMYSEDYCSRAERRANEADWCGRDY